MKEDNIKKILEAGIKLLSRKNFYQLGLQELLKTVNIPKGSFYYYFESKEDFAIQVVDYYTNMSAQKMKAALLDQSKSPRARLQGFFDERVNDYSKDNFEVGCLLGDLANEMAGQSKGLREKFESKFLSWQSIIAQCISEGQSAGEFNNEQSAEELADYILSSWEGALIRMKAAGSKRPYTLFVNYTMNQIL
ncbi:MAG TPA: hypothetical protein DCS93_07230 [Microscillaceae bacterium]|nr:hypothetical protein [Microscillaceae bacterium]